MLSQVDSRANGVTLCTGSLGARADNDLPFIANRIANRIHFVHLRNVTRDTDTVPVPSSKTNILKAERIWSPSSPPSSPKKRVGGKRAV